MNLKDLGYTKKLENFRKEQELGSFEVGRVVSEHKGRYKVKTTEENLNAEVTGKLRFSAKNRADFPAVGDWVAISKQGDDKAQIQAIFPRKTVIERKSAGKSGDKQIIATNIDYAFIVQAVDRDFSVNRIERYLTICNTSEIKPIIILNKIDLIDEAQLKTISDKIQEKIKDVPMIAISNKTHIGYEKLKELILKQKTYCLLGSSGVGKSTLLNNISGKKLMETGHISSHTNKGRHITSHRELVVLEDGGILIDNPGMREVGITDMADGLDLTFDRIIELSQNCKFNDCTHIKEKNCAVLDAVKEGILDESSYENYIRMKKEEDHFESTLIEKKRKSKDIRRLIRNYKKIIN